MNRTILVIALILLTFKCSPYQIMDSRITIVKPTDYGLTKDFKGFARDGNNQIALLDSELPIDNLITIIDWNKQYERGLIKDLKEDTIFVGNYKGIKYDFKASMNFKITLVYVGSNSSSSVLICRTDISEPIIGISLRTLDYVENKRTQTISEKESLVKTIGDFVFKPYSLSEKTRYHYLKYLTAGNGLIAEKDILNAIGAFQIASGHETGLGQLIALKEYLLSKNILSIKLDNGGSLKIEDINQLNNYIKERDKSINILDI